MSLQILLGGNRGGTNEGGGVQKRKGGEEGEGEQEGEGGEAFSSVTDFQAAMRIRDNSQRRGRTRPIKPHRLVIREGINISLGHFGIKSRAVTGLEDDGGGGGGHDNTVETVEKRYFPICVVMLHPFSDLNLSFQTPVMTKCFTIPRKTDGLGASGDSLQSVERWVFSSAIETFF